MRSFRPVERHNPAAIDLPIGRVKKFDPRIEGFGSNPFLYPFVRALAKRGRTLYVGGAFNEVRGVTRQNLDRRRRGHGTPARPPAGRRRLRAVARTRQGHAVRRGRLLLGLGEERRSNLGAVDLRTRGPTAWAPEPSCEVTALAATAACSSPGGCFGRIAGLTDAPGLAAFDRTPDPLASLPAAAGGWDGPCAGPGRPRWRVGRRRPGRSRERGRAGARAPRCRRASRRRRPLVDGSVYALAVRGGQLFIGGVLSSAGGRGRQGLAAARTRGGAVTAFDPRTTTPGPVVALAALPRGGLLAGGYLGGTEFRATSGLARFGR